MTSADDPARDDLTVTLGWNGQEWRVDLCRADHRRVAAQFDEWITKSERTSRRAPTRRARPRKASNSTADCAYLESLGFRHHGGRNRAREGAVLAKRKPTAG